MISTSPTLPDHQTEGTLMVTIYDTIKSYLGSLLMAKGSEGKGSQADKNRKKKRRRDIGKQKRADEDGFI